MGGVGRVIRRRRCRRRAWPEPDAKVSHEILERRHQTPRPRSRLLPPFVVGEEPAKQLCKSRVQEDHPAAAHGRVPGSLLEPVQLVLAQQVVQQQQVVAHGAEHFEILLDVDAPPVLLDQKLLEDGADPTPDASPHHRIIAHKPFLFLDQAEHILRTGREQLSLLVRLRFALKVGRQDVFEPVPQRPVHPAQVPVGKDSDRGTVHTVRTVHAVGRGSTVGPTVDPSIRGPVQHEQDIAIAHVLTVPAQDLQHTLLERPRLVPYKLPYPIPLREAHLDPINRDRHSTKDPPGFSQHVPQRFPQPHRQRLPARTARTARASFPLVRENFTAPLQHVNRPLRNRIRHILHTAAPPPLPQRTVPEPVGHQLGVDELLRLDHLQRRHQRPSVQLWLHERPNNPPQFVFDLRHRHPNSIEVRLETHLVRRRACRVCPVQRMLYPIHRRLYLRQIQVRVHQVHIRDHRLRLERRLRQPSNRFRAAVGLVDVRVHRRQLFQQLRIERTQRSIRWFVAQLDNLHKQTAEIGDRRPGSLEVVQGRLGRPPLLTRYALKLLQRLLLLPRVLRRQLRNKLQVIRSEEHARDQRLGVGSLGGVGSHGGSFD